METDSTRLKNRAAPTPAASGSTSGDADAAMLSVLTAPSWVKSGTAPEAPERMVADLFTIKGTQTPNEASKHDTAAVDHDTLATEGRNQLRAGIPDVLGEFDLRTPW